MLERIARPTARLLVAALIGAVAPSLLAPGFEVEALLRAAGALIVSGPRPSRVTELTPAAAPQALRLGYHLPVTEVPEPPADLVLAGPAPAPRPRGCPVEVRAVVASGAGGFAVVAVPGASDSSVVSVGDAVATPRGRFAVVAIESRRIVVEIGGATIECIIGGPVESESERIEVPPL